VIKNGQALRTHNQNNLYYLLLTFIFLILTITFIVTKDFTEKKVNAESVNTPVTSSIKNSLHVNTPVQTSNKKDDKNTYDAAKISALLSYKEKNDGRKIAFLTFDDGPSTTVTPQILDILKQFNIKATFFLVGENIEMNEKSKELVKRVFNEGHSIGNHTYSHNRGNMLFPKKKVNVPVFMEDIKKTDEALKTVLGPEFSTKILRLPGGYMSRTYYRDPNLPELNANLKKENMISIDWNVESKDAVGKKNKSASELFNILKQEIGMKSKVIILLHDTYGKMHTASALPQLIEYLKGQGYEFKTIK